jgi:hypothetical protein
MCRKTTPLSGNMGGNDWRRSALNGGESPCQKHATERWFLRSRLCFFASTTSRSADFVRSRKPRSPIVISNRKTFPPHAKASNAEQTAWVFPSHQQSGRKRNLQRTCKGTKRTRVLMPCGNTGVRAEAIWKMHRPGQFPLGALKEFLGARRMAAHPRQYYPFTDLG